MWLFLWTTAKTKQGNHAFFTQQTRNQETAHYNFCTHPYNPTRCVLFPLYFLGFGPILLCILRRSAGPPAPDPVVAAAPAGKRNAKRVARRDEEARRRDKVEPKVVQRWHLWTSFSSAGARKRRWRRASAPGAKEKATETKENHGSEMAGQNGGVRGGRVKVSSQAVVSRAGLTLR